MEEEKDEGGGRRGRKGDTFAHMPTRAHLEPETSPRNERFQQFLDFNPRGRYNAQLPLWLDDPGSHNGIQFRRGDLSFLLHHKNPSFSDY